jgi:lipopolysaccharide assembly protein A
MRLFTWLIRLVLFLVMLGFALSNTESVSLRFFGIPEFVWRAPLVLFLLIFFAAGTFLGVVSSIPAVFRQRRQIARLRKDLARALADLQPSVMPGTPAPAGVSSGTAVATVSGSGTGGQVAVMPRTVPESGIRGI